MLGSSLPSSPARIPEPVATAGSLRWRERLDGSLPAEGMRWPSFWTGRRLWDRAAARGEGTARPGRIRVGKEAEGRSPRGPLTSRRIRRPPAGRERTPALAPGRDPCRRQARRGAQENPVWVVGAWGRRARLLAAPEALRPPRSCCHPRRRAARHAAGGGLPRGAPSPSASLPAREALHGEPRRRRGGAGGARALHSPPFGPPARGEGSWPRRGKLAGGGAREGSVSWGPAKRGERQAGRNAARPAWTRSAGRSGGKGPGRRCALGVYRPSRWRPQGRAAASTRRLRSQEAGRLVGLERSTVCVW